MQKQKTTSPPKYSKYPLYARHFSTCCCFSGEKTLVCLLLVLTSVQWERCWARLWFCDVICVVAEIQSEDHVAKEKGHLFLHGEEVSRQTSWRRRHFSSSRKMTMNIKHPEELIWYHSDLSRNTKKNKLKHTKNNLLAAISEGFKGVSWYGWKPDRDGVYNSLVLMHITYILFSCLSLLDFFLFRQVEDPTLIQACMVLVQVIPLSGSISVPRESTLRGPDWAMFLFSCSHMYSLSHCG